MATSGTHDGSRAFAGAALLAAAMTWLLGHPDIVRGAAYPLATAGLGLCWLALGVAASRALGVACDGRLARSAALGALGLVVIGTGASTHLPASGLLPAMRAGIGTVTGGDARLASLLWDSGHVIVFALLAGALGALRRRLRLERTTLLVGLVALAAATEALQRHLPDRTPAVADLAADLAGIGIGLLCARAGAGLRHRRRPAQKRFVMRLGADRRRRPRPESAERRRAYRFG